MKVPASIFREYDVRGVATGELTREVAFHLGRAAGTLVRRGGGRRLLVGRDCRTSGPELSLGLVEGLIGCGCEVLDGGVMPTPVNYWGIRRLALDGGVQITGSHNPPEYNGFKLTLLGRSLHGSEVAALRSTILAEDYEEGAGTSQTVEVLDDYVADLGANLRPAARPLKVVIDAGNGTGGMTAVPLYRRLGYQVEPLFCELDGSFPNHHADPTVPENLATLIGRVAELNADLGIAFDGDADRLGVVDRDGAIVWGDRLLTLLGRALLTEQPGATIIGEVKCSKTLFADVDKHGGRAVMWRTGHSLIKEKMKELDAALAGEMSGHIFYAHRYYGFDDAVYAGGRLLEILGEGSGSIGERLADLPPTVSTPEIRVDCAEAVKFRLVAALVRRFKAASRSGGFRVVDLDGARVEWADGWGLVRSSNTQPLLVLRFEADNEPRLRAIRALFDAEIAAARAELGA